MFVLRLGKIIYMAADKVKSNEKNRARIRRGFLFIAIVGIAWTSALGWESWEDWLFWLKPGDVIVLAAMVLIAALGTKALAYRVFDHKLSEIRSKFSHAAQAYDLCMLARVPIGNRNQSGLSADEKIPEAEVDIAYFLEQGKEKSLYNACHIKGR